MSTTVATKRYGGRQPMYNAEISAEICDRLAHGESLLSICRTEGFPTFVAVWYWRQKYPEFQEAYAAAREMQAEHFVDEIMDLSDDPRNEDGDHLAWSKERIRSRQWMAARVLKSEFGGASLVVVNNNQNNVTITSTDPVAVSQEYRKIIDGD
jgi:hypothetical protein